MAELRKETSFLRMMCSTSMAMGKKKTPYKPQPLVGFFGVPVLGHGHIFFVPPPNTSSAPRWGHPVRCQFHDIPRPQHCRCCFPLANVAKFLLSESTSAKPFACCRLLRDDPENKPMRKPQQLVDRNCFSLDII